VASNFSGGVINPYVSIYAVQLGASPSEMGWLRSLNNLFSNVMQVPWGMACDRIGRYVPFIVLGGAVSSILWLPVLFVTTPWQLIVIVALQAFANSMVAPAWAALLGRVLPKSARGSGTANINAAASLGAISATLFSGFLMTWVGGPPAEMYRLPLIIAAVSGFGASLTMLTIRERWRGEGSEGRKWFDWRALRGNQNFRMFAVVNVVHSFFMSMAWPLFPITIVNITKGDMLQVAYISVISGAVGLLIRRYTGRLSDRAGRKPLIVAGRAGIFIYPLLYAFATNIYHLYVADFIIGILGSISDIAIFAYLLDITAEEQRGASVAVHNTLTGFSTFFGSVLGGYLVVLLNLLGLDSTTSMVATYLVSSSGRLLGGLLFSRIGEEYAYPSTVRKELIKIMTEDMERTKYRIQRAEELGERAELDLRKEMERFESPPKREERPEESRRRTRDGKG
jgi:MFS family permease